MIQQQPTATTENISDLFQKLHGYGQLVANWVSGNFTGLLIASAMAAVLFALLSWIRAFAVKRVDYSRKPSGFAQIFARTIGRTTRFFRIMAAVQLVSIGAKAPWPLAPVIGFLFIVAAVFQCAIWLREILIGAIERKAAQGGDQSDTLRSAMALIRVSITAALFAIATVVVLANVGVNVTGLVAGLGVGGIAIGLAAQGIFSDLFAAIAIIFDQPFKRGDTIGYDGTTGRVERIGMKSTRVRALTGELKVVANNKLLEKELTNFSDLHERRTTFLFGLAFSTNPKKLAALPGILEKLVEEEGARFVRAGFINFGASTLDMQLVFDCDCNDYNDVFTYKHRIGIAVLAMMAKQGIAFAYPTQTTYTAAPDGTMVMPWAPPQVPLKSR
jgi:small-conductance mechanosensitive channel